MKTAKIWASSSFFCGIRFEGTLAAALLRAKGGFSRQGAKDAKYG